MVGSCTHGHLILEDVIRRKEVKDKVMVFTDLQLWDTRNYWGRVEGKSFAALWTEYTKIAPKSKLYLFDLSGYGTSPIETRGNNVYLIAGWSERIFEMLEALEEGSSVVKEIENIEL
jgi:hypothetical protein